MKKLDPEELQMDGGGVIIKIIDGLLLLRMPLPFELDHINLYLVEDNVGWTIIDCGITSQKTKDIWVEVFERFLNSKPITKVVATHAHIDHLGLAGWLCQKWDVPLYITKSEYYSITRSLRVDDDLRRAWKSFFTKLDLDLEISQQIESMLIHLTELYTGMPFSIRWLDDRSTVDIGGSEWQLILSKGHCDGHAAFYSVQHNILISGDHILPDISSNVSCPFDLPESNPLKDWFQSIEGLKTLPSDSLVLPAHGEPFYGLHQRVGEIIKRHEEKLKTIVSYCYTPRSVNELVECLYPNPRKLSTLDKLLACGECLAHLNYLVEQGLVYRSITCRNRFVFIGRNVKLE